MLNPHWQLCIYGPHLWYSKYRIFFQVLECWPKEFQNCIPSYYIALRADSDIGKASGFIITTGPLGFVLTKQVSLFLLRV